jgi:hypothetical protein
VTGGLYAVFLTTRVKEADYITIPVEMFYNVMVAKSSSKKLASHAQHSVSTQLTKMVASTLKWFQFKIA